MLLTETVPLAPNATPFYSQPGLSGLVARLGPNESLEAGSVPDKPCALRYDLVHVEHVVSGCGHLWWRRSAGAGPGRVRWWR